MANLIKPYGLDSFGPSVSTPITSSFATQAIFSNLPAYRQGISHIARGLEVGMSHGYFLLGPFVSLGPLRNSEIANLAGFLSVIGLIIILGTALTIYSYVSEKEEKLIWNKFTIGFVSGAIGGAGFAYGLLENISIF
jgi:photosystem I subunit 11